VQSILFSRIWSSAQDYAVQYWAFLLNRPLCRKFFVPLRKERKKERGSRGLVTSLRYSNREISAEWAVVVCAYCKSNNYRCGEIIQDFTATLNNSLVSVRHRKQIRTSLSYCSVNLTGLGGQGGKVSQLSARCARTMTLITVLNLFFVTTTLNNSPLAFHHCK